MRVAVAVSLLFFAQVLGQMYFCKKGERNSSEATSVPIKIRSKIHCAVICSAQSSNCSSFNWQPSGDLDSGGHCLVFGSVQMDSDIASDSSANYCERYEPQGSEKVEVAVSESPQSTQSTTLVTVTTTHGLTTTAASSQPVFVTIVNVAYGSCASRCKKSTATLCVTNQCVFATIKDAGKQALAEKRLSGCTNSDCLYLWVSLKKPKNTTTWIWDDGEVLHDGNFTNWAVPDDGSVYSTDQCMYIDRAVDYQWMVGMCTKSYTALCDIIY